MDEEEFDSLVRSRSFTTWDAAQTDAQLRRRAMLGIALWGRTLDDLKRQLIAPRPEIPAGFDVKEIQELYRWLQNVSGPAINRLNNSLLFSQTIYIGTQRFAAWEARCEIVRRALEYLENR